MPKELARQGWIALLLYWGQLINDFCYAEPTIERDVPYWYGERPLTGLLATAAWLAPDGWSLEEFASVRGAGDETGRGRGDLWIGLGPESYTIEAKIAWPAGTSTQAIEEVKTQLKDASNQLKSLDAVYAVGTQIAVCYAVPAFHPSVSSGTDAAASAFFEGLVGAFQGNSWLVATYRHPMPPADPEDSQKRVYPGVVLVGQVQSARSMPRD